MSIITTIKNLLGFKKPEPVKIKKVVKHTDKRTLEEKILSSDNETVKTAYFNNLAGKNLKGKHLAGKTGQSDEQIDSTLEELNTAKQEFKNAIRFEFVPPKQANRNVRSYLDYKTKSYKKWKEIRDYIEISNNGLCQICFTSSKEYGKSYNTECHEVWKYYIDGNQNRIQKLIKLEALCSMCHEIKHMNQHYRDKEYLELLLMRYAEINGISIEKAKDEYELAKVFAYKKENLQYKLDLSYLEKFNIEDLENIFDCHQEKFNTYLNEKKIEQSINQQPTDLITTGEE